MSKDILITIKENLTMVVVVEVNRENTVEYCLAIIKQKSEL